MLLGLHEDTNSGAAAIDQDGRILGAVAEERLGHVKYQAGFPTLSLRWLGQAGALGGHAARALDDEPPPGDPDLSSDALAIVAANPYHPIPRLSGGWVPSEGRDFRGPVQTAHLAWQELLHRSSWLRDAVERFCRHQLGRRFGRTVEMEGHHEAHAASAWFTSPWPEATVITCDNMGDGESARAFHGKDGRLRSLWSVGAWHSPGQFYGEVASFLGIDAMTAGKVTGLAARGNPDAAMAVMRERLRATPDGRGFESASLRDRHSSSRHWRELRRLEKADVAAAAQQCLEEAVLPFVREAVRTTGCGKVALAGGVFGNVTLNRRIAEMPEVEAIWVHPAMSDQGIALGAALLALSRRRELRPRAMEHVFCGPSYTEACCAMALERAGLTALRLDDPAGAVAAMLEEGKVVARFDGAVEYGPRALGNRSILGRPDDPTINDWLNERLERSEYMPFAPITLADRADEVYEGLDPVRLCLPFMTVAVFARDRRDPRHAAVIHVDGTVRPQVLTSEANPGTHAILAEFARRTGIPSLLNTSFNRHGEPIVCSPDDAIRTFLGARLDGLLLGPFLALRPEGRTPRMTGRRRV